LFITILLTKFKNNLCLQELQDKMSSDDTNADNNCNGDIIVRKALERYVKFCDNEKEKDDFVKNVVVMTRSTYYQIDSTLVVAQTLARESKYMRENRKQPVQNNRKRKKTPETNNHFPVHPTKTASLFKSDDDVKLSHLVVLFVTNNTRKLNMYDVSVRAGKLKAHLQQRFGYTETSFKQFMNDLHREEKRDHIEKHKWGRHMEVLKIGCNLLDYFVPNKSYTAKELNELASGTIEVHFPKMIKCYKEKRERSREIGYHHLSGHHF